MDSKVWGEGPAMHAPGDANGRRGGERESRGKSCLNRWKGECG